MRLPGFYLLGGGGGGEGSTPNSTSPPPKILKEKNYSKCTKALIMHAHTTLSIVHVYLSTVSINTCCWYTGVHRNGVY